MGQLRDRFWELPLEALDRAEWEALCDGCGRCCLHKLEDEDTGEISLTNVACRLLDTETARCSRLQAPQGVRARLPAADAEAGRVGAVAARNLRLSPPRRRPAAARMASAADRQRRER